MATVYLGLGSNIDARKYLQLGVQELRTCYGELRLSAVYQSAAAGFEGADFLNLVLGFESDDSPHEIHTQIERIHDLAGRDRSEGSFASRALDIDLLLWDDLVIKEPQMKLPRCDILDYSFVLRPLAELAPELLHPVTGKSMADHWQEFDAASHPLQRVDVIL